MGNRWPRPTSASIQTTAAAPVPCSVPSLHSSGSGVSIISNPPPRFQGVESLSEELLLDGRVEKACMDVVEFASELPLIISITDVELEDWRHPGRLSGGEVDAQHVSTGVHVRELDGSGSNINGHCLGQ